MRITAKGRYAIAAMIYLGQQKRGACVPVIQISEKLDISKIYLEQVFSLLKRSGLVISIKGSQGGYQMAKSMEAITLYDIMASTEVAIFEPTKGTVDEKAKEIDMAMKSLVFSPLDEAVSGLLKEINLATLVEEANTHLNDGGFMFYI